MKVAVVTPYYKETEAILMQCHNSVASQTYPCTHILVADGHPKNLFASSANTMHVVLPMANSDNGNTPRAIGGMLAQSYGFDVVTYLDADNWYEPNHIATMLTARNGSSASILCCKRQFFSLEGVRMNISEAAEDHNQHVDTSCIMLFQPAFTLLKTWLMPKQLGPIGDRVFMEKARRERFYIEYTNNRMVCFRTQYYNHYVSAKLTPPPNAKTAKDFIDAINYIRAFENADSLVSSLGFIPNIHKYFTIVHK